jgi:hypothetical protein
MAGAERGTAVVQRALATGGAGAVRCRLATVEGRGKEKVGWVGITGEEAREENGLLGGGGGKRGPVE